MFHLETVKPESHYVRTNNVVTGTTPSVEFWRFQCFLFTFMGRLLNTVYSSHTCISFNSNQKLYYFSLKRAISHFNFVKRDKGWATKLLQDVKIEEFLEDYDLMMEIRGIWQDGQGSVSWLSGTHIGNSWVLHYPVRGSKVKNS